MYENIHLEKGVIKLSLNVSQFTTNKIKTLSLLDFEDDNRLVILHENIHKLRDKFGLDIVKTANEL